MKRMLATEALDFECSKTLSPFTASAQGSTFDMSTALLESLDDLPFPSIQWDEAENDDCSLSDDTTHVFAKRRRTSMTGMVRSREVNNLDMLVHK